MSLGSNIHQHRKASFYTKEGRNVKQEPTEGFWADTATIRGEALP